MNPLLSFHILALGIWIGVVAAEFVIEFDGMKDETSLIKAAKLHYLTDIWVEVPAFSIVMITGLLMLEPDHLSGIFLLKIIFAVLAIICNIICVYAVAKRRKFALLGDVSGMKSTDRIMRLGGLIIPTFLIAFALSLYILFT